MYFMIKMEQSNNLLEFDKNIRYINICNNLKENILNTTERNKNTIM